jgi:hypothetical protein
MAGPYDYTVNIPQPPAQNFLQSLLGIQQLKGLQQQGELAQQQAAIQQQQATFQQQMQPLEMAKAKAAIDAARASAGLTGVQADAARENLTALKERNALVKSYQNKAFEMAKDPTSWTPDSLKSLQMMAVAVDPPGVDSIAKFSEKVPSAIPLLSDAATYVSLAANSGKPGLIVPKLEQYVSAVQEKVDANPNDKVAKIQLQFLQANLATAMVDPNAAGLEALSFLASANDKGYDNVLKGIKQPVEIKEIEAKTKKELAAAKVEEAKLTPGGKEISDTQQKDINTLTAEAVDARINVAGAADAITDLVDFAETNPKEFSKGTAASLNKFFLDRFGDTTKAQNLRAAVQPFVTKDWMAKAAGVRGALSEKEGVRFDKGAPKVETAGPEELLSWLRIVQKVELVDADKKDINAAWQQNARSLQSKAPVEFEVAGIKVKPGDSFQQTLTKVQAGYRKKNQEDIQADAARLKRIQEAGKVGKSPAFGRFDVMGAGQQQQPAAAPKPRLISIE